MIVISTAFGGISKYGKKALRSFASFLCAPMATTFSPALLGEYAQHERKNKAILGYSTLLTLVLILFSSSNAMAATRYAVANGNWNATSTWSATSGGSSGASVPVAGDIVFIGEGATDRTVTIPTGYAAACASITMGNLSENTVATLNFASSTSSLNVSGNLTMNRPNPSATSTIGLGAGSMTVGGNLTLAFHSSSSTANNRLNTITISTGTLTVNGNLIFDAEQVLQSQIVFSGAGTLNIAGNFTLSNSLGTLTPSSGTVNFNGTSAQTIPIGVSSVTYNNLTTNNTNGSGATLGAAVTAANVIGNISVGDVNSGSLLNTNNLAVTFGNSKTLTIAAGSTLDAGTSTITFGTSGTATINGTFITANTNGFSGASNRAINSTNSPTITLGANSTVEYDATVAQAMTARSDYANLTLSGSNTKTFSGVTTVSGTLAIASGVIANLSTFTHPAKILTLGGVLQPTGTHGSTSSSATYQNNTYFAATTGMINVSNAQTFSSSGTFTVPTGVTSITVEVWGGGGRGGSRTFGSPDNTGFGGGGGGGYSRSVLNVTSGATYAVTVGAGSTSNATPGGDSWFDNNTVLLARGGSTVANNTTTGANGGAAGIGDVTRTGGKGANGGSSNPGGGGGSSAGTDNNGVDGSGINGGVAPTGGGNGGNGGAINTASSAGTVGNTPGGGGGGAYRGTSNSLSGGNGANGQVIITWTACSTIITTAGSNSPVCEGATLNLTAANASGGTAPYTYNWGGPGGYSATNTQNPTRSNATTAMSGTYTVTATDANGCTGTSSVSVTVNAAPTAFSVTGGGSYCSGGSGVAVGLSGSESGVNYQLKIGGVNTGSPVAGTGAAISFGNQTAAGTYTVVATNATTSCTNTMTGSVVVTVNPLPTAFSVTGGGSYCSGGSGVAVGLGGSQSGVNYQLKRDGTDTGSPVAGTGSAISFGNQTVAGNYTVVATNTTTLCTATMTGNTVVTVNPLPTAFNVNGGGAYCSGGAGVAVGLSGSESGVNYQLKIGGVNTGTPVAGTGAAISFGNQTAAGTYTVVATNATTSCTATMTGSVNVTVNPLPTAFNVTGGGAYCSGGAGVAVGLSGSQSGVNYQLKIGGVNTGSPVAGTGSAISFGNQTAAGTYTVVATNATTLCTSTMTGSVAVTINALPTVTCPANSSVCIDAPSFALTGGSPSGGTYSGAGVSAGNFNPAAAGAGAHTITYTYTDGNGCTNSCTFTITVNALPTVTCPANLTVCSTDAPFALSGATPSGGTYSGTGVTAGTFDPSAASLGSNTITYTYTSGGCTVTCTFTITVNALPTADAGSDKTTCGTTPVALGASGTGTWSGGAGSFCRLPLRSTA